MMHPQAQSRAGGCTEWVGFSTMEDLAKAIGSLLGCHPHHFVVLTDGGYSLFCSKMAVACLANGEHGMTMRRIAYE